MLADFLTVIPQTRSLVLVTYRPEYRGPLTQLPGAQTVALAPLSDSESAALVSELLGPDPSVGAVGQTIVEKAAGNPFFAEEIVRELAERGVLRGQRRAYVSAAEAAEVNVPATVSHAILDTWPVMFCHRVLPGAVRREHPLRDIRSARRMCAFAPVWIRPHPRGRRRGRRCFGWLSNG
jgi:hypothetical protein